ncbi:piggyBac transposable element-derived protein 3-like [Schistocerca piceifrons]|uniref:piggyBac transposable element-derived protein 3-like n=1 Tax=Schistocerca piceifrons TaxID=274613 RepID=UPI001F5F00EC|nr:piggyBac transposable element-derived protein 3-like [Schistocerca piceifrons]
MTPSSGRCGFTQYVLSNPNPLGLKNFILASNDGLLLDFCIFVGKGNVPEDDLKTLGLGGAVVKLLSLTLPQDGSHVIYIDRFFTSVTSAEMLLEKSIFLTGTVMRTRIAPAASKLSDDKCLKRGEWCEIVRENGKLCVVKSKDNKCVTLLSSCTGSNPVGTCKRCSKKDGQKIDVPCPAVVQAYHQMIGGTDLCDRLLAYYRSSIRTKKWLVRVFNHFVDVVVVNCWSMYGRACVIADLNKRDQIPLIAFRLHLAMSLMKSQELCNISKQPLRTCSEIDEESSTDEEQFTPMPKYRKVVSQPVCEVRYDQVGHYPV